MRYIGAESTYILANFTTGDTVTIDIYRLSDNTKVVDAAACTEISTTGRFKYAFSQSVSSKTEFLYIMSNGAEEQQGKIILGGWPDSILEDTNELQQNQGNWLTATGFATQNPPSQNLDDYKADVSALAQESTAQSIKAKTDNLPASPAPAGEYDAAMAHLDADVSSRSSHSAADVWAVATRTLTSFGSLISDIWAAATRTLTAGTKDSEIDAILADTDELQTNQGNWLTATGFATENPPSQNLDDYKADVSALAQESTAQSIKAKTDTISWSDVQEILKLTGHKVTKSGDIITIYESDGSTVWRRYDLSDGGRVEV